MKTEKIARYIVIGGAFLLPFIPFLVARTMFFPFITGKNLAFRIIVEIMFGAFLLLALRNPAYRPRFSWVASSLAAFLGIIALADALGPDPFRSFWSNYERMEGLITQLHLFAYFLAISAVLTTRKLWGRLLHTSLFASTAMSLYALCQLAGWLTINQGGVRVDGTFGNATYLAVYLLFHIFFLLFLMVQPALGRTRRIVYSVLIALHLFVLINTATRGAILGLIGGLVVSALLLALFGRKKEERTLRKIAFGVIAAVVLLVGGFFAARDSEFVRGNPILARFANMSRTESESRFLIWNMAWSGVKERPVLGWGQENFILVFNKHYNPLMFSQEPWFDRAHNIVFDWLVAAGFLGFAAYLSIFVAAIYHLFSKKGSGGDFSAGEKGVVVGLLAAYFFQNVFVFDNIGSYLLFFSLLAFLHSESVRMREGASHRRADAGNGRMLPDRILTPLLIVLVFMLVYGFNVKGYRTNRALLRGLGVHQEGLAGNLADFKKALSYGSFGNGETREQFVQFAITLAPQTTLGEVREEAYTRSVEEMQKQVAASLGNARYRMFLGMIYSHYGQYDNAIAEYEKALAISPLKQDFLFGLANALINKRDFTRALDVARKAFDLAAENTEARKIYAATAIFAGRNDLAEELLTSAFGTALIPENLFINAYAASGQYGKVALLWEMRVKANPGEAQAHLGLAAAYVELKRSAAAIAEIQKTMELVPAFKEQGEYFIREIRAGRKP